MSDLSVNPEVVRQVRYEELQKIREKAKQNEDEWQDVSVAAMTTAWWREGGWGAVVGQQTWVKLLVEMKVVLEKSGC